MSNAEEFIKSNIRIGSNTSSNGWRRKGVFIPSCSLPWLTPDDARRAVEIAREEIYEWLANHYRDYMHNPTGKKLEAFFGMDMITDLKQAMKDE
jgi:hypothetical protein